MEQRGKSPRKPQRTNGHGNGAQENNGHGNEEHGNNGHGNDSHGNNGHGNEEHGNNGHGNDDHGHGRPVQTWPQWAQSADHHGNAKLVAGQKLNRILDSVRYDFNVEGQLAWSGGDLLVHYQTPLVDAEGGIYMEMKRGTFSDNIGAPTDPNPYRTQVWTEAKFRLNNHSKLEKVWEFFSDWKAPGSPNDFWEPVFHAALVGDYVFVPMAGGALAKVRKSDGLQVKRYGPFDPAPGQVDMCTYVASPITVDGAGNVYYTVVDVAMDGPGVVPDDGTVGRSFYDNDLEASYLVRIGADGSVQKADVSQLLSQARVVGPHGVPAPNAQCISSFPTSDLPWPPTADAVPPTALCGRQRVALNAGPAVDPHGGTIYLVTRSHFLTRHAGILAVNSNFTGRWFASLRERLHDGCNDGTLADSALPINGAPGGCRAGSRVGVDPAENLPGSGRVLDDSSSTPVVGPDGSVYYGAYTRYNYAQGHLMRFSKNGEFLNAFSFGWDSTPGLFRKDGDDDDSFFLVEKENRYSGVGSYCNNDAVCPPDRGDGEQYYITRLTANLRVVWRFQSTQRESCSRDPVSNVVSCVNTGEHNHGFEFCVNQDAVDKNGITYVNSEDGWAYAITNTGTVRERYFQGQAIGAAYTPASIGPTGLIYSQNFGQMFVLGE